jgi:hypothetical protein
VFLVAAIVCAVIALQAEEGLRRHGRVTRGRAATWIGLLLTGVFLVYVVTLLVFYPASSDFEKCMAGANTQVARDACKAELDRRTGG